MFTKRNIVKFAKDQIVLTVATAATRTAIETVVEEPTENQEIGIAAASAVNGFMVMYAVRSKTDQWIDSIADWRQNRKVAESLPAV